MEHISRRTIQDIDILLIVSDASARWHRHPCERIGGTKKTKIAEVHMIITKADDGLIQELQPEIEKNRRQLSRLCSLTRTF